MMKKKKNSGFTLVELMVVIAIVVILAGFAVPNFISWLPDRRLAAGAQDVLQGLQKSRSRAITANRNVVVNYNTGANSFMAFVDDNANGGLDAGELTIENRILPGGINLVNTGFTGNSVTFDNRGIPITTVGQVMLSNSKGNTEFVQLYLSGHSVLVPPP